MIMAVVLLLTAMVRNAAIAEETLHPVIMISEVMASNDSIATYPKADYTDWVEIFNSGDTAVDLSGWGLSDNPEKPRKWQFPDGATIRPGEYRVILCDKEPEKSTDTELHASFTISRKSGEVIILTDAEGAVHDRITLPEMKTDTSFGRDPEDGGQYCYDPPTPFAANGNGFDGYAAAPSFSEEPGFYDSARHLRIIIPEDTQPVYQPFILRKLLGGTSLLRLYAHIPAVFIDRQGRVGHLLYFIEIKGVRRHLGKSNAHVLVIFIYIPGKRQVIDIKYRCQKEQGNGHGHDESASLQAVSFSPGFPRHRFRHFSPP